MEKYQNLGGVSGVYAYEIGEDSITVEFNDGGIYLYTNASAGSQNIENMKRLAIKGKGLNSYISTNVGTRYASKIK